MGVELDLNEGAAQGCCRGYQRQEPCLCVSNKTGIFTHLWTQ